MIRCLVILIALPLTVYSQRYQVEKSEVTFFSRAALEDITATNRKASGLVDMGTGEVAFVVPIASFQFKHALMQQHFNDRYLESDKYPNATFTGFVDGYNIQQRTGQAVNTKGKLTIHGVTRDVTIPGTWEMRGDELIAHAVFVIALEDYNINRPKLLWQNIAEEVEVTVHFVYKIIKP